MPREALIKSWLPPLSAASAHKYCTDILAFGRPGMCRRPGEISPSDLAKRCDSPCHSLGMAR